MKIIIVVIMVIMLSVLTLSAEKQQFDTVMLEISDHYLQIQGNLASDQIAGNTEASLNIQPLIVQLKMAEIPAEHAEHYKDIPMKLGVAVNTFSLAKDISAQREAFKEISKPMAMWASMAVPEGINVVYCSMSPGSWLQKGEDIRNPYYGSEMLKCGEIISSSEKGKMEKESMHHMHK